MSQFDIVRETKQRNSAGLCTWREGERMALRNERTRDDQMVAVGSDVLVIAVAVRSRKT